MNHSGIQQMGEPTGEGERDGGSRAGDRGSEDALPLSRWVLTGALDQEIKRLRLSEAQT